MAGAAATSYRANVMFCELKKRPFHPGNGSLTGIACVSMNGIGCALLQFHRHEYAERIFAIVRKRSARAKAEAFVQLERRSKRFARSRFEAQPSIRAALRLAED